MIFLFFISQKISDFCFYFLIIGIIQYVSNTLGIGWSTCLRYPSILWWMVNEKFSKGVDRFKGLMFCFLLDFMIFGGWLQLTYDEIMFLLLLISIFLV